MIKNRNIALNAAIDSSKIMGSGLIGAGEVFYVYNYAEDATVGAWLRDRVSPDHLFMHNNADGLGLQAALNATVDCRNDYVIVFPSGTNYQPIAALSMTKKGVHLICPAGLGNSYGVGNSARIKMVTAANAVIAVSAQCVEIAGFYLKNYTALSTITLAAGSYSPNIHHNCFMLVWSGAQAAAIAGTGDAGAWGSIENNLFISETGTGQTAAIGAIDIAAQSTGCRVCNNEVTIGDGNTATVAISNLAVKGHTDYNTFSSSGGIAVTPSGGAITNCIAISTMACAIGNRGAVAASALLSGGTSAHSFSDNMDGATGTGNGSASNLET